MRRLSPIALVALVAALPGPLPAFERWDEAGWIDLLATARALGIDYQDIGGPEPFCLTYGEWRWTRDTPGGCRGLLMSVSRGVESGRITKIKTVV